MGAFYDDLETRSADQRVADLAKALPAQVANAVKNAGGYCASLNDVNPADVVDMAALAKLPVLRKSDLGAAQKKVSPLGGYGAWQVTDFDHVFQSPGPIYEPGMRGRD